MKENTQKIYEITAQANDLFIQKKLGISTSVGLMDKALRKKGITADAITVDAIVSKNRLILVLLDNNTSVVGVGIGNTVEDNINLVEQLEFNTITPVIVAELLVKYLT